MLSTATRWRISGGAGLLFVVISFVASAINVQPPPYTGDAAVLGAWFAENSRQYRVGHFVAGLAFLLFYIPFFARFCERLRAAEGTPAIWSRVTWGSAILSPAAGTVSGTFIVGAALLESNVTDEVAAFALAGQFYAFVVSGRARWNRHARRVGRDSPKPRVFDLVGLGRRSDRHHGRRWVRSTRGEQSGWSVRDHQRLRLAGLFSLACCGVDGDGSGSARPSARRRRPSRTPRSMNA